MAKVLYTDFEGVEEVISKMMDNPQLKKAITKTNMYNFWDNILPSKLKKRSKPYSMLPGGIMVVACENPIVGRWLSEINFYLYKVNMSYHHEVQIVLLFVFSIALSKVLQGFYYNHKQNKTTKSRTVVYPAFHNIELHYIHLYLICHTFVEKSYNIL